MQGQHESFKIPATSRFCERALRAACSVPEWHVAAVAVTATQVRLLVRVPASLRREAVIRIVQREAGGVMRRIATAAPTERFWGDRAWCFTLSNGVSVAAVRRHILDRTREASGASVWSTANLFSESLEL